MSEEMIPLPSRKLMWNVAMTRDGVQFLNIGQRCAGELQAASEVAGLPLRSAHRVLDWGCGPCRTLRWFLPGNTRTEYFGCDVDKRAIHWCIKNARNEAEFRVTGATPPLPYADDFFDIVYGVSVFTHLNAKFQELWLAELRRVIRPGGLLLLSLMGDNLGHCLPEPSRSKFIEDGFLFIHSPVWKGVHSDWYADAYHSEAYVREVFPKHFTIMSYTRAGMNNHQDLVVMRKDNDQAA